ncbi:hypothetical protein [Streptomyces sp. NPDC054797]
MLPVSTARALPSHWLWRPNLEPLADFAQLRVIRCTTPGGVARDGIVQRAQESAHQAALPAI